MTAGDLWYFERFARPYAWFMPRADSAPLCRGLERAQRPVGRLVDLAGGTGRAASAVAVPHRLVVDAAAGMLRRVPAEISAVRGDARAIPLADETADAVVIVDALHHLPDPDRVFEEVHRVLRPGGVLVVREFDRGTVRGRLLAAAEHLVGMQSTFFTASALADRLEAAGYEATVIDRGFACTVAGVKPGGP